MFKKFHILVISVACLSLLASCGKFFFPGAGDDIFFTGSTITSKVPALDTKVSYDRVDNPVEGGKAPISWANGDKITINCPEARTNDPENVTQADYLATSINGNLARLDLYSPRNQIGLRWNDDESVIHNFYAVYPSVNDGGVVKTFEVKKITCEIPYDQTPPEGSLTVNDNGNYVLAPDMKWMLMHAEASYRRANFPRGSAVFLNFQPLTTAIQFTIENGGEENLELNYISLTSESDYFESTQLFGKFVIKDVTDVDEDGFPLVISGEHAPSFYNELFIDFPSGLSIGSGKSLEFTFLIPPVSDVSALSLTLDTKDRGTMTTSIGFTDGTFLTFPRFKKSFVKGLIVPECRQFVIDYDYLPITPWMNKTNNSIIFK